MSALKINPRNSVLMLIMLGSAVLRLTVTFDHSPLILFTPVGAMTLFGGAYFSGKVKPFAFPLFTLFISDVVLSFTVYSQHRSGLLYNGWIWVYLAFALMVVAGKIIMRRVTIKTMFWSIVVTILIHWLVSDIGGCFKTGDVQYGLIIYMQRLLTAIPYELRFFAGTVVYCAVMFGTFEWAQKKNPSLRIA
jgi:hypothetical protein